MKKVVSIVSSGILALLLIFGAGNAVLAHEGDDCGCEVEEYTGAERNKAVSNLIKTQAFKDVKKEAKKVGHKWTGAGNVEVVYNHSYNVLMIGVPFKDAEGNVFMYTFFDGVFMGAVPGEGGHDH